MTSMSRLLEPSLHSSLCSGGREMGGVTEQSNTALNSDSMAITPPDDDTVLAVRVAKRPRTSTTDANPTCLTTNAEVPSTTSASLRSLLDAVELEHQRLSSASPPDSTLASSGYTSDTGSSHPSTCPTPPDPFYPPSSSGTPGSSAMSIASLIHGSLSTVNTTTAATLSEDTTTAFVHRDCPPAMTTTATTSSSLLMPDERRQKIQQAIRGIMRHQGAEPAVGLGSTLPASTITTVTCSHAAVAQKSYGNEKRFLCPPPVVRVLRTPTSDMASAASATTITTTTTDKPQISMTVMCENASRDLVQKSRLDEHHTGIFKYLHVAGTDKAKQFSLKLKLHGQSGAPFATFDTQPIAIISKPSKKTVKARNISTCIFNGSRVSLFSRINSQTVRTRYLDTEDGRLCAKNSGWSTFTIKMLPAPGASGYLPQYNNMAAAASAMAARMGAVPITYGSRVILTDTATGISTEPLIIRKVERNRMVEDACGPVSQMQKIALQRMPRPDEDVTAGPILLCTGVDATINMAGTPATVSSSLHSIHTAVASLIHDDASAGPFISFVRPRQHPVVPGGDGDGDGSKLDNTVVDDFFCWTIVGLAKFEYTYCEAYGPVHQQIAPFPELVDEPVLHLHSHLLCLRIRHWLTKVDRRPLEFWLGDHGPLPIHTMHTDNEDVTMVEVALPGTFVTAAVLMEKKKEGGGRNTASLPPELASQVATSSALVDSTGLSHPPTRSYLPYPIYLVRSDGVVYHLKRHTMDGTLSCALPTDSVDAHGRLACQLVGASVGSGSYTDTTPRTGQGYSMPALSSPSPLQQHSTSTSGHCLSPTWISPVVNPRKRPLLPTTAVPLLPHYAPL